MNLQLVRSKFGKNTPKSECVVAKLGPDTRFGREHGMAGGKYQPEKIVADVIV